MSEATEKFPLVMIEWEDSAQPIPSWAYLADVEAARQAVICASVGWLIHDGETVKTLAPNMGALADNDPQVSGVIRIPTRSVIRVARIDEPDLTSFSSVPSSRPEPGPIRQET